MKASHEKRRAAHTTRLRWRNGVNAEFAMAPSPLQKFDGHDLPCSGRAHAGLSEPYFGSMYPQLLQLNALSQVWSKDS